MEILKLSPKNLKKAVKKTAKLLEEGGVIVCPTDTVYGLIADAFNSKAVKKIFKIKKRPKTKPLGVFVENISRVKKLALVDAKQEKFLEKNTPGKITVILKKKIDCNLADLVGTKRTIGMRIIKNKFINELLKKIKKTLAQTSANISGRKTPNNIEEIIKQFNRSKLKPDLIIDAGRLPKRKPSKIIDLTSGKPKILNR